MRKDRETAFGYTRTAALLSVLREASNDEILPHDRKKHHKKYAAVLKDRLLSPASRENKKPKLFLWN
jgi:hypothetical protein